MMRENATGALTEATFFILLALYQPMYGYAVMQFVEKETDGRLMMGAGTLYGAIKILLEKKWIEPVDGGHGRQKQYLATALGREIAEREVKRLGQILAFAEQRMG